MTTEAFIYTRPEHWIPAPDVVHGWFAHHPCDDALESRGYACLSLGRVPTLDIGAFTQWIAREPNAPYRHVLLVRVGPLPMVVLLPTTPDLMAYLARYGAVAPTTHLAADIEDLRAMMTRLFFLWHGHVCEAVCPQCDLGSALVEFWARPNEKQTVCAPGASLSKRGPR